jgi:hypothetical protein
MSSARVVEVFPVSTSAFGIRPDWFEIFSPKLVRPSYLLITLLLVAYVGIEVLKRFEHSDLAKKSWNLPVLFIILAFWPALVWGLKDLVDTFNTYLITEVFRIPWNGFGFPGFPSWGGMVMLPAEGLARLLPNLAYWIVYAFFMIFFFFYSVLGPLILAKGVLFDEMEAFFGLAKEMAILLLWQTSLLVMVAFVMPDIVSGRPFPPNPPANFYFLSVILGVMIFFVPTLTRKFSGHMGASVLPLGFRWGGAALGLGLAAKLGSSTVSAAGISARLTESGKYLKEKVSSLDNFSDRYRTRNEIRNLRTEKAQDEAVLQEEEEEERSALSEVKPKVDSTDLSGNQDSKSQRDSLVELSKTAKREIDEDDQSSD